MNFIDIVFAILLGFALYKGVKNGLFVEVASLLALVVGIFLAIKFSLFTANVIQSVISVNEKYIQIIAFAVTFLFVVLTIHLSAKILTKIFDFAFLGWINKLAGAVFSMLKTILAISVLIFLFEKVNLNYALVSKETLDKSVLYNPVKDIAKSMYPTIQKGYEYIKQKQLKTN